MSSRIQFFKSWDPCGGSFLRPPLKTRISVSADKAHEPTVSLEGHHVGFCDGGASLVKGSAESLLLEDFR